jgi:hydroxymethylbilane synthase
MDLPPGFVLGAITAREDPRDAFVANGAAELAQLPPGARVGTSSLRREAQLRARFPQLAILPVRGNVHTRLRKLDEGEFDALILAAAGLIRLGLADRIREYLSVEASIPAPGQGALGIECIASDRRVLELVAPLQDTNTTRAVAAERTVSRLLGGSCQLPLGAYAECRDGVLTLNAFVATPDGRTLLRAAGTGGAEDPEALGEQVAAQLRARGADAVLSAIESRT